MCQALAENWWSRGKGNPALWSLQPKQGQLKTLFQQEMVCGPAWDIRWKLWEEVWAAFLTKLNLFIDFQINLQFYIFFRENILLSTCGLKRASFRAFPVLRLTSLASCFLVRSFSENFRSVTQKHVIVMKSEWETVGRAVSVQEIIVCSSSYYNVRGETWGAHLTSSVPHPQLVR